METRKIAVACFIGGASFCIMALIFTPSYWWLGFIAGLAGGYVSYEFREICWAIPIAFLRTLGRKSADMWKNMIVLVREWFLRPHPFLYFGMLCALPLIIAIAIDVSALPTSMGEMRIIITETLLLILCYCLTVIAFSGLFVLLACIGAMLVDHRCWDYLGQLHDCEEVPLTYVNAAKWILQGTFRVIKFLLWDLWMYLAIIVGEILRFSVQFAWHLFRLIHSHKRILCAIDGTLGGTICYIWLVQTSTSFVQQALLVIFGGFLGAAIGVVNWEIVSKRIFHVSVNGTMA